LALACAAFVVLSLLPLPALIARPGLDPSWVQGLHVAAERGLAFGRDIVFTFGPLGFAHMREYWPGLFAVTVAYWALLALGIVDALARLARAAGATGLVAWPLFAIACAFAIPFAYDAFVVLYLLLWVAMVEADEPRAPRLAAHSALAGLAALSKFPFAMASGLALAIILALVAWRRQASRAVVIVLAWTLAFLAGWLALSQPLSGLPAYVVNSLEIVEGYPEAMSRRDGPRAETHAYGALALLLAAAIAWAVRASRHAPLFFTGLFVLATLVLTWRQAFTRHDERGPSAFAFLLLASIVMAVRLAPLGRGAAWLARGAALACIVALAIVVDARTGRAASFLADAALRPVVALKQAAGLATGAINLAALHDAALARMRRDDPLPSLPGTVDAYSHDHSAIFAHALRWNPRPIFHSYQANTDELAELNRRHLAGPSAPDHLLVRIQPIDGRLPASEDGASWLTMLERYALRSEEGFVVLDRQPAPAPAVLEALPPWRGSGWRDVPAEPALVATLTIHEPPRGFAQAFRRPTPFEIQLRTETGEVHGFRFLRSVGRAPFILSPLVRTNADFASLFVPCHADLGAPKVAAVRILGDRGREVPFTLELEAVRELPRFESSASSGPRAVACRLRLLSGVDALRSQPFVTDGKERGLNAHPPATFGFTHAVSAAKVCTRLVRAALEKGPTDGYAISLGRKGEARPAAHLRVTREMAAGGEEACVEARFGRAVDDVELRVEPGGNDHWDWVYITRVEVDG
jgi:hypothetical protein